MLNGIISYNMELKGFEIEIFKEKPQCAAYMVDGTLEVYFKGFTLKKVCSKTVAKQICEQLHFEWEEDGLKKELKQER